MKNKELEYYKLRAEQIEKKQHEMSLDYSDTIISFNNKINQEINKAIYENFKIIAKENNVSILEARKLLTNEELEIFQLSLEYYAKLGKSWRGSEKIASMLKQYESKIRIQRLQAIKVQIQALTSLLYEHQELTLSEALQQNYENTFNLINEALGGYADFDMSRYSLIKPWTDDGLTFSDRIWTNQKKVTSALQKELTKTIIQGKAPDDCIKYMTKFVDNTFKNVNYAAGRLVMTEMAFAGSKANLDCYKENDVEQYQILATLDKRTSEICREQDDKVYDMKLYEIGVTAPPFHPYCRTTTVPYFEDLKDYDRFARDDNDRRYIKSK